MVERLTSVNELTFLPSKQISKAPSYCKTDSIKLFVNNFPVNFLKKIMVQEFAVFFDPPIGIENKFLKDKVFRNLNIKEKVGANIFTGDACFVIIQDRSFEKTYDYSVEHNHVFYNIKLQNTNKTFSIDQNNLSYDMPVRKMLFELLINEVIKANPNIDFDKRIFVRKDQKQVLSYRGGKVSFFPGFTTSIQFILDKAYINVALKNRFLREDKNCLQIIKEKIQDRYDEEQINDHFASKIVKTTYSKRNYKVQSVNFSKSPANTQIVCGDKVLTLVDYYKVSHSVKVVDTKQWLFEVLTRENEIIYLIPELCLLSGIDDSMINDRDFMTELAGYTKFTANERVTKTREFPSLLACTKQIEYLNRRDNKNVKLPSSAQLKSNYGINIVNEASEITAYTIKEPVFLSNSKALDKLERQPANINKLTGGNTLIVYHKSNYSEAEQLLELFSKAGKDLSLALPQVEWEEVSTLNAPDWVSTANKNYSDYKLIIFIITNKTEHLYSAIKRSSLCDKGYISQVVKAENIRHPKKGFAVATKLLQQMNQKCGGNSYVLSLSSDVKKSNFMIVGVDSSHISGKRTGVAMVATLNSDYTEFYNEENIIEERNKEQLVHAVGKFINSAVIEYFKVNKTLPQGVIIYRQGVSKEQKEYLKHEVANIEDFLSGKTKDSVLRGAAIKYYYVIVNKKTNFKFFEKKGKDYDNPKQGLVVFNGVTEGTFLEFFLQPQFVTQGTATPTHFHVAFGNLDKFDLVVDLTYKLCFIYPNWPGPVRVPMVLKLAEKLSKMVAKVVKKEIHSNLKTKLSYI